MNRYIIQYHSKTLAALSSIAKQQTFPLSWEVFNYPNLPNCELKIVLSDHVKKTDNINLHTGLSITADVKADSEEEAKDISKNYAETLLNLISFFKVCKSYRRIYGIERSRDIWFYCSFIEGGS